MRMETKEVKNSIGGAPQYRRVMDEVIKGSSLDFSKDIGGRIPKDIDVEQYVIKNCSLEDIEYCKETYLA